LRWGDAGDGIFSFDGTEDQVPTFAEDVKITRVTSTEVEVSDNVGDRLVVQIADGADTDVGNVPGSTSRNDKWERAPVVFAVP
jgi:hypothetical protein